MFSKKFMLAAALLLGLIAAAFGQTPDSATAKAGDVRQEDEQKYDFYVTATTKDSTHPHFNEGNPLGFVINGVQGRPLVLVRGRTYTFSVKTPPMHDFYLSLDPMGWGTNPLTQGVKGNFTFRGVITFTPTAETPDLVYYACRNHQFMGGEIHIVNAGEEDRIKLAAPSPAASGVAASGPLPDKGELQQRINFVNMYVNASAAAKRIADSNNEAAKAKYKEASDKLAAASAAFDAGDLREAKARSEEAMSLMKEATRFVPSDSMLKLARSRYEELLRGIADMEASYKQNREAIAAEGGSKNLPRVDTGLIHKKMDEAKALTADNKYDEANRILTAAMNELSQALNQLLANRNMAYEMKFASEDKEYEYELARYDSLEKLIPVAVEQKQPDESVQKLMQTYVDKAKMRREQASADAGKKNYGFAIQEIKDGSEQLDTALKLMGVH
jgi:hypothetical protein